MTIAPNIPHLPEVQTPSRFQEMVDKFNTATAKIDAVADALLQIEAMVGLPLANLETDNASSVVAGINSEKAARGQTLSFLGDISTLATTNTDSAVAAINEVIDRIGVLNDLDTDVKTSIVQAMNDLKSDLGTIQGALADLDTVNKGSFADAINELNSKIGDLSTMSTTDQSDLVSGVNSARSEILTDIGDLAALATTAKSSFVAALNELKASLDAAELDQVVLRNDPQWDVSVVPVPGLQNLSTSMTIATDGTREVDAVYDESTTSLNLVKSSTTSAVPEAFSLKVNDTNVFDASALFGSINLTGSAGSRVYGESFFGVGVHGATDTGEAIKGDADSGTGLKGTSSSGDGVIGESTSGYSGKFTGGMGLYADKIIQDGTEIAASRLGNLASLARSQIIVNPVFNVSQEWGLQDISVNGAYPADQWSLGADLTNAHAQLYVDYHKGTHHRLGLTPTVASTDAGAYAGIFQSIEGSRVQRTGWCQGDVSKRMPITVVISIHSEYTGTIGLSLRRMPADKSYVRHLDVVTGENFFVLTVQPPPADVTFIPDSTISMSIALTNYSGSTYAATATDQWLDGNFLVGPSHTNPAVASPYTNSRFYVRSVMMFPGEHDIREEDLVYMGRSPDEELALCRRYWETITTGVRGYSSGNGAPIGCTVNWTPKRVNPSTTIGSSPGRIFSGISLGGIIYAPQLSSGYLQIIGSHAGDAYDLYARFIINARM